MSVEQWLADEIGAFSNNLDEYIAAFYSDPTWKALRDRISSLVETEICNRQISVLDLGSGPIPSLPGLYTHTYRYYCVEPSRQFSDHLQQYYPNVTVIQEPIESLALHENDVFDVVLAFGFLHHIFSPDEAVASMRRWTRDDGIFVAHEPSIYWNGRMGSPHERGFTRQELISMIEPHFRNINIYSYHFPSLRKLIYRVLSSLRLWPILKSERFGKLVIELEFALDRIGASGTSFVIIATDGNHRTRSIQETS